MAILRCKDGFVVWDQGFMRVTQPGDLVDSSDPLVKGHEQFFETVETNVSRRSRAGDETATAGPGDVRKRSTRKS